MTDIRDDLFNRGDTAYFLLDYTVNGEAMVEDAYQDIELQINNQSVSSSVKKQLSKNEIIWRENFRYKDKEGVEHSFTGYVAALTQVDTFKIKEGKAKVQLRVLINDEVGSSDEQELDIGKILSKEVLGWTIQQ